MQDRMFRLEEKWRQTQKAAREEKQDEDKENRQLVAANRMRGGHSRFDRRRGNGITQEKHR